ncbi:MAG TPA: hypothetical protein VHC49_08935 [Mycobacteriales bacterium]|nr:hypothetical protein [Mycobacteriales bacterium]
MSEPSPRDAAGPATGEPSWPEGWIPVRKEMARPVRVEPAAEQIAGTVRSGVRFPIREPRLALVLGLILGPLFCAGAVVLLWAVIARGEYPAIVGVLLMGGLGGLFLTTAVVILRHDRSVPRGLLLTPHVVCGPDGKLVLPWDSIAGIRAEVISFRVGNSFRRTRRNYVAVSVSGIDQVEGLAGWARRLARRATEPTLIRVATRSFEGNAAAALHAMRYYLAHPQERADLENGTALARITG